MTSLQHSCIYQLACCAPVKHLLPMSSDGQHGNCSCANILWIVCTCSHLPKHNLLISQISHLYKYNEDLLSCNFRLPVFILVWMGVPYEILISPHSVFSHLIHGVIPYGHTLFRPGQCHGFCMHVGYKSVRLWYETPGSLSVLSLCFFCAC